MLFSYFYKLIFLTCFFYLALSLQNVKPLNTTLSPARSRLQPRTTFLSCTPDQQRIILDAVVALDNLVQPAINQALIESGPEPDANRAALTYGQQRFAHWFRQDNHDQRLFVWNRLFSLWAATELAPRRGAITFQCHDPDRLCRRNNRLPGYVRASDPAAVVICTRFYNVPHNFHPNNQLRDRVSHLFYLFSHSSRVWNPPARDYPIRRNGPTNLTPLQARNNPVCYIFFTKDVFREQMRVDDAA